MTTEVKLNLLMVGLIGRGKSATGNTLLDKRVFKASSNATSETKEPDFSFAQFENKVLLVVDGPGLANSDMTVVQDREAAAKNMSEALGMCYGGVDAFLFVTKYGNRFTPQETAALEDIKKIFGDKFMERVILLVTCGDIFQNDMEEEGRSISFDDWCREHRGALQKLYKDCGGRVVLFNNRERDEKKNREQRRKVVEMAEGLKNRLGRYTSRCFQQAEYGREKMILEHKAPLLEREFEAKICLGTGDIEHLQRQSSERAETSIRARVKAVKKAESYFNDREESFCRATEIEEKRGYPTVWGYSRTESTVAGGFLGLVGFPLGLLAGGAGYAAKESKELLLSSDAKELEQAKKELKRNIEGIE